MSTDSSSVIINILLQYGIQQHVRIRKFIVDVHTVAKCFAELLLMFKVHPPSERYTLLLAYS